MNDAIPPVQGLVAGKYEILGLIGRGGMGSVWEGRHTSLGTRVAVKFIDPEYAESQEACARFVTEARAAATIQSKYAIQIFDHGVTEAGRPYIVMELLVGEPLDKRLERLGRLSLTETARIIGHVSRALQRAHDAGIIHRDLKPENIFLVRTPDDDDEIAKVLDFGIAKIKAPPGEQGISSSTKTGAVLGTPYYMSPEQARGLRNIDHRSDLWSLGVIAHKCVTGVLPFEGESVGDLLVKICTAPLPTPSVTVPGLTATFDAWFARALEREPARRFGRASELADGLNFAAGLSARGAASSHALSPVPVARTISASAISLPAAGVTSAPITTPSVQTKSSRGVLLGVVAAAVVGGAIGIAAVVKLAAGPRAAGAGSETAVLGASTAGSAGAVDPAFSARASSSLPPSSLPPSSAPPPSASAASPGAPATPPAVVAAMQGSPGPLSTTATPWPAPRPKLTATPPALAPAPTLPPASPPTPAPRP
ncbi:MAG TPA: serine/threonine-protein kinase, partial [Polyangiaceae bacterium]|nr:serine/threonine-protein kinase [Polyangiaceae bacterium]